VAVLVENRLDFTSVTPGVTLWRYAGAVLVIPSVRRIPRLSNAATETLGRFPENRRHAYDMHSATRERVEPGLLYRKP